MTPQPTPVRRLAALAEPLAPSALRGFHAELFDAVLWDGDLDRVVALTAAAVGAPVAIVVPRLQLAHVSPHADGALVAAVVRHVAERMRGRPAKVPAEVLAEASISRRGEPLGAVLMLAAPGAPRPGDDAEDRATLLDCLHFAATATLARVAAIELRASVEHDLHGALLQQLREQPDADPQLIAQRAARLGCDLTHGAIALCVEPIPGRERTVAALVAELLPGALVEPADARIAALLPLPGDEAALERVRELVTRLEPHGAAGASRHCADVARLGEALEEAELVLDVVGLADEAVDLDSAMSGTYRLLFRLLASHPGEVSALFEATVAPLVRYDDHHRTDLVATLATYLELNGNMNATAARIFAHRHTVAYRLDRIRELTGLDPADGEHRERLGLGLKAHRLLRRDAAAG